MKFDTLNQAVGSLMGTLHTSGNTVIVKGKKTLELAPAFFSINQPGINRFPSIKGRGASIFPQVAETLWMLYGLDNIDYLSRYLPRAADFSDDGKVWRAAYGPRLRQWPMYKWEQPNPGKTPSPQDYARYTNTSIDQVANVIQLLKKDMDSRQAVMTIWNPALDWVESKDIPCNNWIQFLVRKLPNTPEGIYIPGLVMNVTVRSNDAMWGFSGINFFEWAILQQYIADAIGVEVGPINWFAGSFHLYEQHYERAKSIHYNYTKQNRTFLELQQAFTPTKFINAQYGIDGPLNQYFIWEERLSNAQSVLEILNLSPMGYMEAGVSSGCVDIFPSMFCVIYCHHLLKWYDKVENDTGRESLYQMLIAVMNIMGYTEMRHVVLGQVCKYFKALKPAYDVNTSMLERQSIAAWTGHGIAEGE